MTMCLAFRGGYCEVFASQCPYFGNYSLCKICNDKICQDEYDESRYVLIQLDEDEYDPVLDDD